MVQFYYSFSGGGCAWRTLYYQQSLRPTPKSTPLTLVRSPTSTRLTRICHRMTLVRAIYCILRVWLNEHWIIKSCISRTETGKVQHRLLNLSVIKIPVRFIGRLHDVQLVRARRTVSLFTIWSPEQPRGYLQTIGSPVLYPGTYFLIT